MAIQMIGIDHSVAAIDIRTVLPFTQKKTVEALEIIKQEIVFYFVQLRIAKVKTKTRCA